MYVALIRRTLHMTPVEVRGATLISLGALSALLSLSLDNARHSIMISSVFGIFNDVALAFNCSILISCRNLVLNARCRHLGEIFLPNWFLDNNLGTFLNSFFHVQHFVIHRRVNLIALTLGVHQVPIPDLTIITTSNAVV